MLEDPKLNFAISSRGGKPGLDHLGFQVDEASELAELKSRAEVANMALLDEGTTTCCYAQSEKHWITDPQGIAWEHFHTLQDIPVFSESHAANKTGTCCTPTVTTSFKDELLLLARSGVRHGWLLLRIQYFFQLLLRKS
jgi:hypothetical protein